MFSRFRGLFLIGVGVAIAASGCAPDATPSKTFRSNVEPVAGKTKGGKPRGQNQQVRGFIAPDQAE